MCLWAGFCNTPIDGKRIKSERTRSIEAIATAEVIIAVGVDECKCAAAEGARRAPAECYKKSYFDGRFAIYAMSKSFAIDWGRYGIRSNCVLVGIIKTVRREQNLNNAKYCLANYTPIEDIATFEDVANAAWYLGSDESRNTTGTEIIIDGGMLAQLTPNMK